MRKSLDNDLNNIDITGPTTEVCKTFTGRTELIPNPANPTSSSVDYQGIVIKVIDIQRYVAVLAFIVDIFARKLCSI